MRAIEQWNSGPHWPIDPMLQWSNALKIKGPEDQGPFNDKNFISGMANKNRGIRESAPQVNPPLRTQSG